MAKHKNRRESGIITLAKQYVQIEQNIALQDDPDNPGVFNLDDFLKRKTSIFDQLKREFLRVTRSTDSLEHKMERLDNMHESLGMIEQYLSTSQINSIKKRMAHQEKRVYAPSNSYHHITLGLSGSFESALADSNTVQPSENYANQEDRAASRFDFDTDQTDIIRRSVNSLNLLKSSSEMRQNHTKLDLYGKAVLDTNDPDVYSENTSTELSP